MFRKKYGIRASTRGGLYDVEVPTYKFWSLNGAQDKVWELNTSSHAMGYEHKYYVVKI